MEEPNKDLKEGDEETPSGADLPEKNSAGSDDDEDNASGASGTTGTTGTPDETETMPKSELEQLRKDAEDGKNYRKAFLKSIKGEGRNLPGSEPEKKKKVDDGNDFGGDEPNKEEFVTRTELVLRDEKRAINDACKVEEVLINWEDIVVFYQRPKENTYETQSAAIQNAVKLWKADKGITDKPVDEDKKKAEKAKQDLASEKGLNTGKDKKPIPLKKTIIPHKEKMEDWYGKK